MRQKSIPPIKFILEANKKEKTAPPKDPDELYATSLQFLWEQYNKILMQGVLVAGTTIVLLLQGVLFNRSVRELLIICSVDANKYMLLTAIGLAGLSAIFFISSRWCSQILMERQVYGNYNSAIKYFEKTLNNETILPTALRPKVYMGGIDRLKFLIFIGNVNEVFKWIGVCSILLSWIFIGIFSFPFLDSLTSGVSSCSGIAKKP